MSLSAPLAPHPERIPEWLRELPCRIGEVLINRDALRGFVLCHRDDAIRADLPTSECAETASEIARYDDEGKYRALKTAPNLRHGWKLALADSDEVRLAIDLLYPGRAAAYEAFLRGKLTTTAFRETLARQTGMYRAAARITEEQAAELIGRFCRSEGGCLRTILWKRDEHGTAPSRLLPPEKFDPRHDQTGRGEVATPLLCQEICSLVVAAAREVVKAPQ